MTSEQMFAWAAGLFEGEGTFLCCRRGKTGYTRGLVLVSTDEDVVRRFAGVVNAGRVHGPRIVVSRDGIQRKPIWRWRTSRWVEIEPLTRRLLPYLGARRRAAAEKLLANPPQAPHFAATCRRGHERSEKNTYVNSRTGQRQCRVCQGRTRASKADAA